MPSNNAGGSPSSMDDSLSEPVLKCLIYQQDHEHFRDIQKLLHARGTVSWNIIILHHESHMPAQN